jgi:hypothetical protein
MTEEAKEQKKDDKDINFRRLEAKYERELSKEREEKQRLFQEYQSKIQEIQNQNISTEEEEETEPYVDHKVLKKKMSSFEKQFETKIEKAAESKVKTLLETERRDQWLRDHPDFSSILDHAEEFAQRDPELAESILRMPDSFERQKLVYSNIKAFGLHKPKEDKDVQDVINNNKKSAYYQPGSIGTNPGSPYGDFSNSGQKAAYEKMQELKARLHI